MHLHIPQAATPTRCGQYFAIFLLAACAYSTQALAQSVALSGVLGSKALLVVDGTAPKTLSVGESHMGVKLLAVDGEQATLEIRGQRSSLRVGDAPVSVGTRRDTSSSNKITVPVGSGGHFFTLGQVNGKSVQFLVDTGATSVALSEADAQRLGVNYRQGQQVRLSTANGVALGWRVKLNSVRIGDVEVFEVDAIVGIQSPYALLGNSFLSRFSMLRTSDMLVLERRY